MVRRVTGIRRSGKPPVGPIFRTRERRTPVALPHRDPWNPENAAIDCGVSCLPAVVQLDGASSLKRALIENNEEQITLQLAGGERSVKSIRDELRCFKRRVVR